MNKKVAFFVEGEATISLQGDARLIDGDGNIVKHVDLNNLGVIRCEVNSMSSQFFPGKYGLTFRIDDIFFDKETEG